MKLLYLQRKKEYEGIPEIPVSMNPGEYSEVKLPGYNDNIDCQIDKTWNHLQDKSLFLLERMFLYLVY